MKRINIFTLILASAFTACQEKPIAGDLAFSDEMSFELLAPGVKTRVASDVFEQSDKIGLYVTDYVDNDTPMPLQVSGNRASNVSAVYDGASWTPARTVYWGEGKSDVYAYYPYIQEISDVQSQYFSVALDQDSAETDESLSGYEASDLLWGKAEGVARTGGPVNVQMNHVMSKLIVKIVAGKDYVGSLPDDASVLLHSTVAGARFDLSNGSVVKDPYSGAESIKMRKLGLRSFGDTKAVVYEAIVVPQMLETIVPLLEINSKSVSYLLEDSFNFRPGVVYTYTATLNTSTTAIKVEIGCELEDWNSVGGGGTGSGGEGGDTGEGETGGVDISLYEDLSAAGTANCYLISKAGKYRFPAVLGNTTGTVGNVKSVEVLWESFGTDVAPQVGDLIEKAEYSKGYICFETPAAFKNGNAVIAVKNTKGTILWSWHIWCSEEGWKEQIYFNDAGTMMDRNLGATTAEPYTVGTLGLLYQWGRKDPFLGSESIYSAVEAASTGTWKIDEKSSSITIYMADTSPMTFYCDLNMPDYSWGSNKTANDPCPAGWRVPDGGENGIWAKALGRHKDFTDGSLSNGNGLNFSGKFGSDSIISYPAAGYRDDNDGSLNFVGSSGDYWSVTPSQGFAYYLYFNSDGNVLPAYYYSRSSGRSVRCVRE